jgi:signal peptidase II
LPPAGDRAPEPEVPGLPQVDAAAAGVRTRRTVPLLWWLSLLIVVLDQASKALVQSILPVFDSRTIIPGLLDLVHVQNAGVAFGFLNDVAHPLRSLVTTALALAALVGIGYYARHVHPDERLARLGLSLVLGGAVGNLVDRMRLGHVIDFVDVYWRGWHFWAFNVADAAITIGAVLIFLELLFPRGHVSDPV